MRTESHVSLQPYNTFGIDTVAELFITLEKKEDVKEVFQTYPGNTIIGGGSNILLSKTSYEIIVLNRIKGKEVVESTRDEVIISVGSGENWHQVVMWALENDFGGLENLSLIPGTVGAAPIQNIGAYGVELKDVLYGVDYYRFSDDSFHFMTTNECNFGYRDSIFKNQWKNKGFISKVYLRLTRQKHQINTDYQALKQYLEEKDWHHPAIQQVSQAVIAIRESKLPDWRKIGNAGSFFKNPVIDISLYNILKAKYSKIPSFPIDGSNVKIPAAWLIQEAGFKGIRKRSVGTYEHQPLVLVNHGGGRAVDILHLKEEIQSAVQSQFGIRLVAEVTIL